MIQFRFLLMFPLSMLAGGFQRLAFWVGGVELICSYGMIAHPARGFGAKVSADNIQWHPTPAAAMSAISWHVRRDTHQYQEFD